jgi:hypothetical protein
MRYLIAALIAATLSLPSLAYASGGDIVLLANGGRVRGTVIVEDPATGVRIRLADGTIRNIPAKEVKTVQYEGQAPASPVPNPASPALVVPVAPVAPVAPPPPAAPVPAGVGSIHVETTEPATVTVDGGVVGKSPADVHEAAAGRHQVHVDFEGGGSREEVVLVQNGQTSSVKLEVPASELQRRAAEKEADIQRRAAEKEAAAKLAARQAVWDNWRFGIGLDFGVAGGQAVYGPNVQATATSVSSPPLLHKNPGAHTEALGPGEIEVGVSLRKGIVSHLELVAVAAVGTVSVKGQSNSDTDSSPDLDCLCSPTSKLSPVLVPSLTAGVRLFPGAYGSFFLGAGARVIGIFASAKINVAESAGGMLMDNSTASPTASVSRFSVLPGGYAEIGFALGDRAEWVPSVRGALLSNSPGGLGELSMGLARFF